MQTKLSFKKTMINVTESMSMYATGSPSGVNTDSDFLTFCDVRAF